MDQRRLTLGCLLPGGARTQGQRSGAPAVWSNRRCRRPATDGGSTSPGRSPPSRRAPAPAAALTVDGGHASLEDGGGGGGWGQREGAQAGPDQREVAAEHRATAEKEEGVDRPPRVGGGDGVAAADGEDGREMCGRSEERRVGKECSW